MDPAGVRIVTLAVGPLEANCYLVLDEQGRRAAVIDPGDEAERILRALGEFRVEWIAVTHAHFDHVGALKELKERTGAPFFMHPADREILAYAPDAAQLFTGRPVPQPPEPDGLLEHGQTLRLGSATIEVRHTPGHSPGGVSFVLHVTSSDPADGEGDEAATSGGRAALLGVFTGDALFAGSIGRTDLPGGDYETLLRSIRRELLTLPDTCPVYPGHGPATTIGQERRANPFLQGYPAF